MPTSNLFGRLLKQFDARERLILHLIHDLRVVSTTLLKETFPEATDRQLTISLLVLLGCGVVRREGSLWTCTWLGAGVANWGQQLRWRKHLPGWNVPIPAPHQGENGDEVGPTCHQYRPVFFSPGYCWCGRGRAHHFDQVLQVAESLLRPRQ